jgi:hypothetical protein
MTPSEAAMSPQRVRVWVRLDPKILSKFERWKERGPREFHPPFKIGSDARAFDGRYFARRIKPMVPFLFERLSRITLV